MVIARRRLLLSLTHQLQRFSPDDRYERCGFLFRRSQDVLSLIETQNGHVEPETNFRVDGGWAWTAKGAVGVLHTHPGRGAYKEAFPSASDHATAFKWPALFHVVYHPYTRRLTVYDWTGVVDSFHLRARWVSKKGI